MITEFKFPDVGEGITEGELVKWIVKVGDQVKEHQNIAQVETDKAVVDIPSPVKGTILKLHHKEGDTIKVGEVIATIGDKGEKLVDKEVPKETPKEVEEEEAKEAPKKKDAGSVVGDLSGKTVDISNKYQEPKLQVSQEEKHVLATPATRRLARELSVNLDNLQGSGKEGRITEEDVRKNAKPTKKVKQAIKKMVTGKAIITKKYDMYGYINRIPLTGMRKAIARNMVNSKARIPHVTTHDYADVTELVRIRKKEKIKAEKKGYKLTYLPFIVKAVIQSLQAHPEVNSSLDEEHEEVIIKKYYNIGIAVDTENGLIVPNIKRTEILSIAKIAKKIQDLAERAIQRKIDLAELRGGTFTITNYGVIGGQYATPIINHPECAILGTGRIEDRVMIDENKEIVVRKVLPLSLSFDHRIIDGAKAQRFMNTLIEHLEDPNLIMLDS